MNPVDLRKADAFAGQATSNWRADTRDQLASAALGRTASAMAT